MEGRGKTLGGNKGGDERVGLKLRRLNEVF